MSTFKIADEVAIRMIQIFQEACFSGVDSADLFREVRMESDPNDPHVLVLSEDYKKNVKKNWEIAEARGRDLHQQAAEAGVALTVRSDGNKDQ
jgi:hypothetical protein